MEGATDRSSPPVGTSPPGDLRLPPAWLAGAGIVGAGMAAVGCTEACQGEMINEQPHQLRLTFGELSRASAELSVL